MTMSKAFIKELEEQLERNKIERLRLSTLWIERYFSEDDETGQLREIARLSAELDAADNKIRRLLGRAQAPDPSARVH